MILKVNYRSIVRHNDAEEFTRNASIPEVQSENNVNSMF